MPQIRRERRLARSSKPCRCGYSWIRRRSAACSWSPGFDLARGEVTGRRGTGVRCVSIAMEELEMPWPPGIEAGDEVRHHATRRLRRRRVRAMDAVSLPRAARSCAYAVGKRSIVLHSSGSRPSMPSTTTRVYLSRSDFGLLAVRRTLCGTGEQRDPETTSRGPCSPPVAASISLGHDLLCGLATGAGWPAALGETTTALQCSPGSARRRCRGSVAPCRADAVLSVLDRARRPEHCPAPARIDASDRPTTTWCCVNTFPSHRARAQSHECRKPLW